MKKLIYIVCGLAIFFVCALVGLMLYTLTTFEVKKNFEKTKAARDARWRDKPVTLDENATQDEVNKALDDLNEKRKQNENEV